MASGDTKPDNVSQLRDQIDSGKTGDKVAFPDPAAAPLGTDAETGGNPPSSAQLAAARTGAGTSDTRLSGPIRDRAGVFTYVFVAGAAWLGILAIVAAA